VAVKALDILARDHPPGDVKVLSSDKQHYYDGKILRRLKRRYMFLRLSKQSLFQGISLPPSTGFLLLIEYCTPYFGIE